MALCRAFRQPFQSSRYGFYHFKGVKGKEQNQPYCTLATVIYGVIH